MAVPRSRPRRYRVALCVMAAVLFWLVLPGSVSHAHAELTRSDPKEGAELAEAPRRLSLTFGEAVSERGSSVEVAGEKLPLSRASGAPRTLVADLSRLDRPLSGKVAVAWRSSSETDGHTARGTLRFTVDAVPAPVVAPPPAAEPVPREDPAVRPLLVAVKVIGFVGLALFVGGLAFLALLWPRGAWDRRVRGALVTAWTAGALAAVAGLGLQAVHTRVRPLSDVVDPGLLGAVLTDRIGEVGAVKGLLWLLAAVVLAWAMRGGDQAVRRPAWRIAALAVGFGLLRTTGMTAHAAASPRPFLSQTADLLHLAGVSLWFGGLAVLLVGVLRRRRPAELAEVVPRYSTLALVSVLTIAASGLLLTWQLVGSFGGLLTTDYGRLLLAKLAVFALVLGAAQRSKRWVAARLDAAVSLRSNAATVRPFLYSVAIETALLCVVLLAAALLVTASPGR
ncbi:copper resistance CopC/CopD family protein [Actinomadura rugatobispora]|uniref:Copper resistance CopC/CopD family protein n=1 Tax=Actinomadura rugatobispora TaxID=1994 RepID=A0ABW0ZXA8_9ACTN|nr:hypothetical protein GCM10010200_040540 [Actinomadura rugatobispora]